MSSNPTPPKKKLEELAQREVPREIWPLYPVVLETLAQTIKANGDVTTYQREFSYRYTLGCLDKDTEILIPLAARAYVDLKMYTKRTADETDFLQRLVAALKALPAQQRDEFAALVKVLSKPLPPLPPLADAGNDAGVWPPGRGSDGEAERESSKAMIAKMQQCLKGTGDHAVPNYNEATAQAALALSSYPHNPDVILQAAICFHARGTREMQRALDERLGDIQRALELMEEFLVVTVKPPYNKLPEYKQRREAVTGRWHEIREKLQEQKNEQQKQKQDQKHKQEQKQKPDQKKK